MREQYLVSPEKTALAVTIANRERDILKNIDYENGYSLYVGIPFCPSICLYCSLIYLAISVFFIPDSSIPIAIFTGRIPVRFPHGSVFPVALESI